MHEGAAAPSYLRPGLGLRRAGVSVRKQRLRTSSRESAAFEIRRVGFAGPRSGPRGRFLYHFLSRPGPRFTCPGFRPCGALRRCPRASSRVNAASDRPSPKVTKGGRALARLATANFQFAERTRRRAKPFDGRQRKMMQLGKMKILFFRRVLTLSTPRGHARHWAWPFDIFVLRCRERRHLPPAFPRYFNAAPS